MNAPQSKSRLPFFVLSGIIFGIFGIYFMTLLPGQSKALPLLGKVNDFELTDSQGQSFSTGSLKNKIWVTEFFFTTCAGPCPIMTANLASIYRSYLLEKDVNFVSITVNPETDTPQVLTEYAKRYGADTSRWHFLTGSKEKILKIAADEFKTGSTENPIFHSSHLILVDRKGNIRGYYDGTDKDGVKSLFKDIAVLRKEKP